MFYTRVVDVETTQRTLIDLSSHTSLSCSKQNMVVRRTGMFDDQHDCLQASVDSERFSSQTSSYACCVFCHSRCSLCSGSSLPQGNRVHPVRVSQIIRAARARSLVYLSHGDCPEPETVDQECELPFFCGLGTGLLVVLNHRLFESGACA